MKFLSSFLKSESGSSTSRSTTLNALMKLQVHLFFPREIGELVGGLALYPLTLSSNVSPRRQASLKGPALSKTIVGVDHRGAHRPRRLDDEVRLVVVVDGVIGNQVISSQNHGTARLAARRRLGRVARRALSPATPLQQGLQSFKLEAPIGDEVPLGH